MAIPRIFISSTCYDLKHIRENLKYFVKTIGYEPVLSDEGDVYYNPSYHTHDSCIKEVETCQLFILIIGGRYGGEFKEKDTSITNNEYKEAIRNNVPIFTLVENAVHSDHHLYTLNKKKNSAIAEQIEYPSIDNIKIFNFIDEVRKNSQNNAIFAFNDFSDMEIYLKKQWAGMMYDFLLERHNKENAKMTNKLLDDLSLATRKSEELMKILLKSSEPDSADKTISDIDNKVEAENFVRLIFNKFKISSLDNITVIDLNKIDLNQSWIDFLEETKNFHTTHEYDTSGDNSEDLVLWGQNSHGIGIGKFENDKFIPTAYEDIEKSYNSLKKLNKDDKNKIYENLIHGI